MVGREDSRPAWLAGLLLGLAALVVSVSCSTGNLPAQPEHLAASDSDRVVAAAPLTLTSAGITLKITPYHRRGEALPPDLLGLELVSRPPGVLSPALASPDLSGAGELYLVVTTRRPLPLLMLKVGFDPTELSPAEVLAVEEENLLSLAMTGRRRGEVNLVAGSPHRPLRPGVVFAVGFVRGPQRTLAQYPPLLPLPTLTITPVAEQATVSWQERIPGDFNNNGEVDFGDAADLVSHFGLSGTSQEIQFRDVNGDNLISFVEVNALVQNFGSGIAGYQLLRRAFSGPVPTADDFVEGDQLKPGTVLVPGGAPPHDPPLTVPRAASPPPNTHPIYTVVDQGLSPGTYAYLLRPVGIPPEPLIGPVSEVETVSVFAPDTTPPQWDETVGITRAEFVEFSADQTLVNYRIYFGSATDPSEPDGPSPPVRYNIYVFQGALGSLPSPRTPTTTFIPGPDDTPPFTFILALEPDTTYTLAVLPEDSAGNENPALPDPPTVITTPAQSFEWATVQGDPQRSGQAPFLSLGPFDTQNPVVIEVPPGGATFRIWPVVSADRLVLNTGQDIRAYHLPLTPGAEPLWTFDEGGIPGSIFQAPPLVARGVVVAVSTTGKVLGLDLGSGTKRWERSFQTQFGNSPLFLPRELTGLSEDRVVVAGSDGSVYALDLYDGATLDQFQMTGSTQDREFTSPPTLAGDLIALGTRSGKLVLLRVNGLGLEETLPLDQEVVAPISFAQPDNGAFPPSLLAGTGGVDDVNGSRWLIPLGGTPLQDSSLGPTIAAPLSLPAAIAAGSVPGLAIGSGGRVSQFSLLDGSVISTLELGAEVEASPISFAGRTFSLITKLGSLRVLTPDPLEVIWQGDLALSGEAISALVPYQNPEGPRQLITTDTSGRIYAISEVPDTTPPVWDDPDSPGVTSAVATGLTTVQVTFGDADDSGRGQVYYYIYADDRPAIRFDQADQTPDPGPGMLPRRFGPFQDQESPQTVELDGLPPLTRLYFSARASDAPLEFADMANVNSDPNLALATTGFSQAFKKLNFAEVRRSAFVPLDSDTLAGVVSTEQGVWYLELTLTATGFTTDAFERVDNLTSPTVWPVAIAMEEGTPVVIYGHDPDPPSGPGDPEPFFRFDIYRATRTSPGSWTNTRLTFDQPAGEELPVAFDAAVGELIGLSKFTGPSGDVPPQATYDTYALFDPAGPDPRAQELVDDSNNNGFELDAQIAPAGAAFDPSKPVLLYYRSIGDSQTGDDFQNLADLWYARRNSDGSWTRLPIDGDAEGADPTDLGSHPRITWLSDGMAVVGYFVEYGGSGLMHRVRMRASTDGLQWMSLGEVGYSPPRDELGNELSFFTHRLGLASTGSRARAAFLSYATDPADDLTYDLVLFDPFAQGTPSDPTTIRAGRLKTGYTVNNSLDLIWTGSRLVAIAAGKRPLPGGGEDVGLWLIWQLG